MTRISQKIVGYSVVDKNAPVAAVNPVQQLVQRPPALTGHTYKVKTPEHSVYITINNFVDHLGETRPFEIFINSKSMEHFQWVVALTRLMSAIFRQGGECSFLIEELHSIFDPKGGFFHNKRYVTSLVAVIGDIVEQHLTELGLYHKDDSLQQAAISMLNSKLDEPVEYVKQVDPVELAELMEREPVEQEPKSVVLKYPAPEEAEPVEQEPTDKQLLIDRAKRRGFCGLLCTHCNELAMFMLDGCLTCTNCGFSKCG